MNILSAENISKSYSEKKLIENVSIGIDENDRIGLIGVNGTGKSTLLKVIAGVEKPDSGRIIMGNSVTVGYLPQNPVFREGETVIQQVFTGHWPVMKVLRQYEQLIAKQSSGMDSATEKQLISIMQQMDELGAWNLESQAKTVLSKLGIDDFDAEISTLSGGQRKRVAMAGALISPSELLILDEPTNHIDNSTVDWLEKYLNARKGALLMVTHDRYFLERVTNRIIELDNGRLFSYQANYSKFLEMKAEREEMEQASEKKRQNLLRNELAWIRRGAQARSTKQKARIDRFNALKDIEAPKEDSSIEIKVGAARLGRKIIELNNVSKAFGELQVIKDFSYILLRDDRIGIIGHNGAGKSTLLNILSGFLSPDSGSVEVGQTVKIGFFTQECTDMNDSLRVIEYIREQAEYLETAEGQLSASQMLERFLFPPAVQWTPISKLSGGEKRRLYLLRILMSAPNVLLLDEPTNDLDIQTLSILEDYLEYFPGAVIAVSHDRFFLDRVADRIFSFEGNGFVRQLSGNYTDYVQYMEGLDEDGDKQTDNKQSDKVEGAKNRSSLDSEDRTSQERRKDRPLKFTYKEQKEFDEIDSFIEELEQQLSHVKKQIDNAASDFVKLNELLEKQTEIEKRLELAIERWTYLNELAEKIANQSK